MGLPNIIQLKKLLCKLREGFNSILQIENMGIETICAHIQMEVIMNSRN